MTYESITSLNSPNHSGARKKKITSITIHHWGVTGQRFDNVARFLCRAKGTSSAHYVVEAGKVACIVDPDNIAWHAGVWARNEDSIGIECRPEATDGDYATVAELVRELRAAYGDLPLKAHRDWKATACPGKWDLARIDRLARTGVVSKPVAPAKPSAPAKPAPAKPKPKPVAPSRVLVVGSKGARVERLQRFLKKNYPAYAKRLVADGIYGPATKAVVAEFQRRAGLKPDGEAGPATHKALGLTY